MNNEFPRISKLSLYEKKRHFLILKILNFEYYTKKYIVNTFKFKFTSLRYNNFTMMYFILFFVCT